jgi:hypothetical protein
MGMVSISREDYPNAAGSHAGSENIDEWLKKKYAISQQTADANTMLADARRIEADSLAKQRNWEWNPDLESSKGVGGYRFLDLARQKNLDASAIARDNAEISKLGEETERLAMQNKLESELYGDTFNAARAALASKRMLGIGEQQAYGQAVNKKIAERNRITGENNPLIATFQGGNPVFENIDKGPSPLSERDVFDLSASGDALARENPYTLEARERIKRRLAINKASRNTPYTAEYNMW